MSIAEKITSITNHLTDDYVGIANLGVDLTNVDKNIQNIKSCLDGIYNDYPKTEYGEDLNVSLSNTKKGKMQIIPEGNNTQKSTTGKNLWANTLEVGFTTTINGVKFTVNEDRSITVDGLATANAQLYLSGSAYNQTITEGTYTFSGTPTGVAPGSSTFRMQLQEGSADSSGVQYLSANENGQTITLTSPTNTYRSYIIVYSGYNAQNLVFKPQFEVGSTKTDYEQYTGGLHAPNPAYLQYINRATGNNKFLFNGSNFFSSEIELGTIGNNNGTPASETRAVRTKDFIPVAPNTRYCVSNDMGYACYLYEYDRNQKFLKFTSSNTQFSFVTMEQTRYVKFRTVASRTENDTSVKYMLNLGQTPLTWEAYTGEVLPLNLSSKNLLKPITYSRGLSAGITWDMSNGSISASGTSTSETYSILSSAITEDMKIELLAGTYTLSGASGGVSIQLLSASGTALALDTGTGKTFTINEKTICYYRGIVANNTALDGTVIIYPQLEERKCSNNL